MKIAIIAASPRPIPASMGGATQTMMTHLLDVNEELKQHTFGVFSYFENEAFTMSKKYEKSTFFYYEPKESLDRIQSLTYRFLRKVSNHKIHLRSNFISYCAKIINKEGFDVVVLEGNCFQANQIRQLISNKLILHMHIDRLNVDLPETLSIMESVDGIFAISNFCKERMLEVDPGKSKSIVVVKNTIDTEKFTPVGADECRDFLNKKFNFNSSDRIITYCGRLVENKGVLALVKAINSIKSQHVKLMIIGSSVYLGAKRTSFTERLQNQVGDNKNIVFTGFIKQDQLPTYIKASDLVVVPSICNEAAGNVIIESLSCGVPVVASTQGGIPEYASEKACSLVPYNDNFINSLSSAISYLITHKDEYDVKASNARSVALSYDKYNYYNNFCSSLKYICNL